MTPVRGYSEMKDSGIPWIGMIPKGWTFQKIKRLVLLKTTKAASNEGYIGLENIESWSGRFIDTSDGNFEAEGTSIAIAENDIIFGKLRPYLAKCFIANKAGCCSPEFIVMKPNGIDSGLLKYNLLSPKFIDVVNMSTYGAKMPRTNWEFIGNLFIAIPNKAEQSVIGAYLDEKCSKIDEIIASAKASIEDYKQWKASIIYEAVTKGLDPDAEMKDSGIEWIGKIPKGWKVVSLKTLCSMQAGKNLTSEDIKSNGEFPVYGGNGIRGFYSDYNRDGKHLLIGRQGALCGNVHCVDGKFWATEHAVVTSPTNYVNIEFLFYLLIAMNLNQYASNSAAQPGLSVSNILNIRTILPPLRTQNEILGFLKKKCNEIEKIIEEKQSLIIDLESYKKSLIYEVVTGKRKVC